MEKNNKVKLIISILVLIMTLVNVILFSVYAIERTDIQVPNTKVSFDVYFKVSNKKIYEATKEINAEGMKLYISLKIDEGYLKTSEISFADTNFELIETENIPDGVENIDFNNNKIVLKQLSKGESIEIPASIKFKTDSKFDVNNLKKKSQIILNGTYINNKAKTIQIQNEKREVGLYPNKEDIELNLERNITKYIKTEKNIILQEEIISNIEKNELPVEETTIYVQVPQINSIKPKEVNVYVDSSKATNGKINTQINSTENIYTYDKDTNTITVKLKNEPDEKGIVSWEKSAQDKLTITYIYSKEVINIEEIQITNDVACKIKAYNYKEIEKAKTINDIIKLNEEKGNKISITVNTDNKLNKGYLYGKEEKIEYKENYSIDVSDINQEELEIISERDIFINEDESIQNAESYYVQTTIPKDSFINILGEDGTIQIYDENNKVLATVNNNTELKDDKYIITYSEKVKNIKIKTTTPIKRGKLEIENKKYMTNTIITKENIEKIKKIQIEAKVITLQSNEASKDNTIINFEEPIAKVQATISNKNLLTLEENKNVELRIELKTRNEEDKLFSNPEIKILMPSYIANLKINQNQILFSNGLQIQKVDYNNEDKTITVNLDGAQTKHNDNNSIVVIYADILLDKTVASGKDTIKVVTNNESEQIKNNISIKTISSNGLLIISNIKNAETGEDVAVSTENELKIELPLNDEQKELIINKNIVNNYGEKINNLEIIEELVNTDNTFNGQLVEEVKTSTGKVYYSIDNGKTWKENVENFQDVKLFKIVITEESAEKIGVEYKIKLPEKLNYNSKSIITSKISYSIGQNSSSKQMSTNLYTKVKAETNKIQNLLMSASIPNDSLRYEKEYEKMKVKIGVTSGGNPVKESDTVKEGQYLKYTVEITNISSEKLTNVNLKSVLENANSYALVKTGHVYSWEEEKNYRENDIDDGLRKYEEVKESGEENIELIEPNKTVICSFQTVVHEDAAGKETNANIHILIDENNIDTIKISNKVVEAKLKLTLGYNHSDNMEASTADKFGVILYTKNISEEDLKDITISIKLPKILENCEENIYEEDEEECYFDDKKIDGNTIYYTLNKLKAGETNKIILLTNVLMDVNLEEIEVTLVVDASVGEEKYTSNEFIKTIYQDIVFVNVKQEGSIKKETVKNGDRLIYQFTITNTGNQDIDMLEIVDKLPDGVRLEDIVLIQKNTENKYEISSINYASISNISLDVGETITINLVTTINISDITDGSKEITNYAIISNYAMEKVKTNEVTYKIYESENDSEKSDFSNGNLQDENKTNTISGIAWQDENQNGARDSIEPLLGDIRIILINEETQDEVLTALTSNDGTYTFENVPNGKYVMRFEYDNSIYSPTTYQKVNISYTLNSDAIETKDSSGNTITTTDTIEIINNNVRNIDIGLVRRTKFDLKLDKYISSITVQNKQGVKTYTYTDQKLAKVEIPAKYMYGSNVIIEYTIVITNEGDVPGFAKNIVDYIPSDMKFNSELNTDWYVMSDGYAYNTSLDEIVINPGERIDTQLTLTKTINSTDSELINNIAEIFEDYNTSGLEDVDSIPGNKIQEEDDISNAELIISIKTGEVLRNLLIAIIIIAILAIGIYKIKKVNNGKEKEDE